MGNTQNTPEKPVSSPRRTSNEREQGYSSRRGSSNTSTRGNSLTPMDTGNNPIFSNTSSTSSTSSSGNNNNSNNPSYTTATSLPTAIVQNLGRRFLNNNNYTASNNNSNTTSSNANNATGSNNTNTNNNNNHGGGVATGNIANHHILSSSPPPFGSPLDTPSFLDDGFTYNSAFPDPVPVAMVMDDDYPSLSINSKRSATKKDTIPTVFRWNRGGKNVYVTGTFNGWKGRIPLNKSHDEFSTIVELPPGSHQYKFIIDDEWMYSPDQPTIPDPYGAMNNYVEVLPIDVAYDIEADAQSIFSTSPPGVYGQEIPPTEYGAKPPPVLPPHLLQVVLNADPVSDDDPTLLPIPNHVMLNHLYALSIKDGVMVLGVTHRFKKKYITTVLYRSV